MSFAPSDAAVLDCPPLADLAVGAPPPTNPTRALRVWPLVPLLVLSWVLWKSPTNLPGLGSARLRLVAGGSLLLLWWLCFSRARWHERLLGLVGLAVVGIGGVTLADQGWRPLDIMRQALPWGATGFAAALIALHRWRSPARTAVALMACLLLVGYWDLVRIDSVWGDKRVSYAWRWIPTAEERFLVHLDQQPTAPPAAVAESSEATAATLSPDWAGFRGPRRDSHVPGIVLASDWEAHPPRQRWRGPMGPGWSSFCVAGNRLFTQEQRGEEEAVVCLDRDTGAETWVQCGPGRFTESMSGPGPRATPTLAGDKLFTLGGTGLLQCLNPLTGQLHWQRDLRIDADRQPPTWGFCSSPLVVGNVVIVYAGGGGDRSVLAYDILTGEPQWSVPAGDDSYSSPHLARLAGQSCVLMLTNAGLTAIDAAQGKVAWEHAWPSKSQRVVQPLVLDEQSVLLGTGMGGGTRRIEVTLDAGRPAIVEGWTTRDMKPDFNDGVVHRGHLFGFDRNIFACVSLVDGSRKWKGGRYGNGQVLLLPDGEQLLVLTEEGELVLLRADPEKLDELARFKAIEGKTWNHPVLVGNLLFVRNGREAACFEMPVAKR
jgi:outer membrane protein assembly factor BamB